MNTLKTLSVLLVLSACATACADGSAKSAVTQTSDTTTPAPPRDKKSATPVSPAEILTPRPGETAASSTSSDYVATEGAYRLFGITPGDGTLGVSATIADTTTWATQSYAVGDPIGRGLVVSAISSSAVTLHGTEADIAMAVGVDTNLRVIHHVLDIVALPLGNHRFSVSTAAAKAALETAGARPSATAVTLYDLPMVKLSGIAANGLWQGADFREGDLIALVDGAAAGDSTLASIETGLTDGRAKLAVTIYRAGVAFNRSYEVLQ